MPHYLTRSQQGFTLTELMVAMALGLSITLAAFASFDLLQSGYRTVDAATQLRDNARFASTLMQRVILQAGYMSTAMAIERPLPSSLDDFDNEPHLKAFNNALYRQALAIGTSSSISSSQRGINGSDLLVVRYQVGAHGHSGRSDHSMINCTGNAESAAPLDADERLFSVFHIAANQGEPTLMCTYRNEASGTWITQPLITGVESLQLLFGTHQVTAGRAPTSFAPTTTPAFVEQYLRPDQLLVTNNANASNANWARVRSVRVGMVLRGPVGSLGAGESAPQYAFGTPWLCQAADTGCLMDSTADGRLRHSVSFTVHLRNPQYIP